MSYIKFYLYMLLGIIEALIVVVITALFVVVDVILVRLVECVIDICMPNFVTGF
jgi:hypothetical protein